MIKKISLAFLLIFLMGCASTPLCKNDKGFYQPESYNNTIPNTLPNFNTERYVWEDFIFTTNRVNQTK